MTGMLRSENPTPSSGCGPARQVDGKDLHPELLVIHGHCCPRTQRDRPCSVGQSSQDAPSPKGPPTVPVPGRTSPLSTLAPHSMREMPGPTSRENYTPQAPLQRDAHALHGHR